MQSHEVDFSGLLPIEGYGPGFFRIGGVIHEGALALLPAGPEPWRGLDDLRPFLALAGQIELVIIGTGADFTFLPPGIRSSLEGAGLGVEIMSTGAACRSYNVLLAEQRRLAAALIPV
jgi:uncharacterized protein